jgi:uncharacterized protein YjbI with pentapeptide repeats
VANPEHLEILRQGVEAWNAWRGREIGIIPNLADVELAGVNLTGADFGSAIMVRAKLSEAILINTLFSSANLGGADLTGADLRHASFSGAYLAQAKLPAANLSGATLVEANLRGANLVSTNFTGANLEAADLSGTQLIRANLSEANLGAVKLSFADLSEADLTGAILHGAMLVRTNLTNALLTGCRVYGISAWDVKVSKGTKQQDLVVTPLGEPEVTTDDLEVAQFIYLLLRNEKLQRVIDTITSKVVLILGRFSPERKMVLDALRDELRNHNYVPVMFDFEKPNSGTTINTVTLLARMARFVIADVSDAKSVLLELQAIVPNSPKLPVLPIIVAGQKEPGMFDSFEAYPWFLKVHPYENPAQLLVDLKDRVIGPLEDSFIRSVEASNKSDPSDHGESLAASDVDALVTDATKFAPEGRESRDRGAVLSTEAQLPNGRSRCGRSREVERFGGLKPLALSCGRRATPTPSRDPGRSRLWPPRCALCRARLHYVGRVSVSGAWRSVGRRAQTHEGRRDLPRRPRRHRERLDKARLNQATLTKAAGVRRLRILSALGQADIRLEPARPQTA